MTRANILLTWNSIKTVCVIDSTAYPESLPNILTSFDEWVSCWNEQRINRNGGPAEYAYEVDFDERTIRGWKHECRDWDTYDLQRAIKTSVNHRIEPLPAGWILNDDTDPVQVKAYQILIDC